MVYLATDLRLGRKVAVKVMHSHLAEDDNFRRRFEQEARSAAGLSHPNLVGVFDQGHDAGHTYLVMEYLPSITLRALLKQQKALTADQSIEIGEAILSGLAAAHAAGIVHRDLKPENVMLADDGRIKLGDFGLARAVSANTTTGQALLGTIAYLSPELVTRGIADARSDLYAFGIMFYEMLVGAQPFVGEQPMQIAYQHANSEVPRPSLKSPEAGPELDELVLWTTRRDPEERPRDASVALDYLVRMRTGQTLPETTVMPSLAEGEQPTSATTVLDPVRQEEIAPQRPKDDPASAHPASTPIEGAATAARRRTGRGRIAALLAVLLIASAGGLGWWFGQGPGSRPVIPSVAGLDLDEATSLLEAQHLSVTVFKCSSLTETKGLASRTEPEEGTRVDRGSTVELCQSTGPERIPVPTLIGLSTKDARATITDAGFTFGTIVDERFSDESKDTVLAALGENGKGLGKKYPERGRIDLIASAGAVPEVAGMNVDAATSALSDVDLSVNSSLNTEHYTNDFDEGQVIGVVFDTDPVRPGDQVGLQISLGPELFDVPNVKDLGLAEAMDTLTEAGFEPTTLVPEALREFAKVTGTDPEAGERLPLGSEIRVKSTLSL